MTGRSEGESRRRSPWGLRSRVSRLYGSRRQRLLLVPQAALEARFGSSHVEADDDNRWLRTHLDDGTIVEVGFAGTFRMFGALIDTQWTARRGAVGGEAGRYEYRFDKGAFVSKGSGDPGVATRLADSTTQRLAGRSEIKRLTVLVDASGTQVELVPLAGTITAVYFPPMPPYTVVMKEEEAKDHIALVLHLLDR